jgi:hypothetical protein
MDFLELKSLMETLGITDHNFTVGLYQQLISADSVGGNGLEFAAAVIKGTKPKDQLEVMLAAQMAVVHMAMMKFIEQLGKTRGTPQQDSAASTVTKLARTYTAQTEALKRYRTGGEQKVTVQHVSVSEGGQAIVGNVTQTALEKPADKTLALTDARQPAMPIIDTPERVPVAVRRRQKHGRRSST